MTTIIQKVIKIGDSAGVTLPAKELKKAGIQPGDSIEFTFQPVQQPDAHTVEVVAIAQDLIKRHKKALKNLSQR